MKNGKYILNELLFWTSLISAITAVTGIFAFSDNRRMLSFFVLLSALSAFFTVFFLRKLYKHGRSPLAVILKRLSANISKAASSIFKRMAKRAEKRRVDKTYLGGRDYHYYGENGAAPKKTKRGAKLHWSRLDNCRDRIRFLYLYILLKKRKNGKTVSPCDTPLEQIDKLSMNKSEANVTSAYSEVRWNYRDDILSESDVYKLKTDLNQR